MDQNQLADLEVLLGHSFRNKDFLLNALSHSSIKSDDLPSNERLEFLGDSVLGLVVSETLYRRFPSEDEGVLTRIKSHAVSRAILQRVAAAMGLERFILVGKGVLKREIPASLLGNLFEAIVGAIYLDTGLAAARKFLMRHLDVVIGEIVDDRAERNYKSMLQHYCQREHSGVPSYRVHRESGPAHGRNYDVSVLLNGREHGRARADSKKEAEQGAARGALLHFRQLDENPHDSVRGAGTLLAIGPPGRGPGPAARGPAPAEAGEGDLGGRRRRRRRRGGRQGEPQPAAEPRGNGGGEAGLPPDARPEAQPPAPAGDPGAQEGPAEARGEGGGPPPGGAPRRRRRRGGRGRGRGRSPGPGAGEAPPPPASAP
ncbi:MAG: ribonuclease III [Planctomycetaceae bacterium]